MIGYLLLGRTFEPVPMIGIPYKFKYRRFVVVDQKPDIGSYWDVYKVEFEPISERRAYGFDYGYYTLGYTVLELV